MGIQIHNPNCQMSQSSHNLTHKIFLICNYILLGAASSCIFLALSLRLVPSAVGLLFILLHVTTIAGSVTGCAGSHRWYAFHAVATVLTAVLQGSVSVLIFTTTADFLGALKSYVREDDGEVILKMAGGLCVVIFCLEWVGLSLAFLIRFRVLSGGNLGEEDLKNWPWPSQV